MANKQPPLRHHFFNSLYWRIAATFSAVLLVLAGLYVYLTAYAAKTYFEATHQRLNREVAAHIAKFTSPFADGKVSPRRAEQIFFDAMVMNPSIEVYLLDSTGRILAYHNPDSAVALQKVALAPVKEFLRTQGNEFILGDDPRNPHARKIFSAAEVAEDNCYIYAVLASEAYDSVTGFLLQSHARRLATQTMFLTITAALVVGLLAFWRITKNLNHIIQTVKRFREGDWQARITLHSTSELGQLSHTFNEMADTLLRNTVQLQSAEKLRRELVANVSHDLRTPIATVHGYTETLLMRKEVLTPAERDRYTEIILQSTARLQKLVEALFELSKLEAQEVTPHPEPFVLAEILQGVQDTFQIRAGQKGIALACELCEDPSLVYADVALLERVMQNLVENALKFTQEGGKVTLRLDRQDEFLKVSVIDTGPGIPEEVQPFLFDRSQRVTNGHAIKTDGTGLGLIIVKKILELHQTHLSVQTSYGQGSCFSFRLARYIP